MNKKQKLAELAIASFKANKQKLAKLAIASKQRLAEFAIASLKAKEENSSYRVIHKSKDYLVVEFPPCCRTIKVLGEDFYDEDGDYVDNRYYLSFPYMQFCIWGTIDHFAVSFSKEPVKGLDTLVHLPLLPNFRSNGNYCLGDMRDVLENEGTHRISLDLTKMTEKQILHLVSVFWRSDFVIDDADVDGLKALRDSSLKSFDKWEALTKKNPKSILKKNFGLQMKLPYSVQYLYQKNQIEAKKKPKKK